MPVIDFAAIGMFLIFAASTGLVLFLARALYRLRRKV